MLVTLWFEPLNLLTNSADKLKSVYAFMRKDYRGLPLTETYMFDVHC